MSNWPNMFPSFTLLSMPDKHGHTIYLIIYISAWAFFMDGLGVLFLSAALAGISIHWIFSAICAMAGLFFIVQGLVIHGTTAAKLRGYALLKARNSHTWHPDSFKKYMNAPCGRQVVKAALRDLGCFDKYKDLTSEYQTAFCAFDTDHTIDVIIEE